MHRDAGNGYTSYDMGKMKQAILESGDSFHLFGGEPLLMKEDDLEELLRWGFKQFGENGIQTNGALINANHIRMFKQYGAYVGLSIDGPGKLNDVRWAGTLEKTRAATAKSEAAIEMLCEAGIKPGLMIQLTRCNVSKERMPIMMDWLREMDKLGIHSVRLHVLEIEHPAVRAKYALSIEENIEALFAFMELEQELKHIKFDLSTDIRDLLLYDDTDVPCVWRSCDAYTTTAVHGIDGQGLKHNCGLTDKEGINFQKPDVEGFERYVALYYTPQEYGGCKGCRFFLACKGHCPGTGIDRDWRNRSEYCGVWKKLFTLIESQLVEEGQTPLSLHPNRKNWEVDLINGYMRGKNPSISCDLLELA